LRIAVDTMSRSPFACAVVWGSQLTVIPNDAYVALKGSPITLGARFDTLWHDDWESLGPSVFDALAGRSSFIEHPPVHIARCDHADGIWCALGYTPLNDELGEVAGFVHTIIETTATKGAVSIGEARPCRWRGRLHLMPASWKESGSCQTTP